MTNLHLSTLALSAYNWLAAYTSGPVTLEALLVGLRESWDPRVELIEVTNALSHSRAKRFFIRVGNTVDVTDSQRRIVEYERFDRTTKPDTPYLLSTSRWEYKTPIWRHLESVPKAERATWVDYRRDPGVPTLFAPSTQ